MKKIGHEGPKPPRALSEAWRLRVWVAGSEAWRYKRTGNQLLPQEKEADNGPPSALLRAESADDSLNIIGIGKRIRTFS
jgi:hypothetical protein